MSSEPVSTHVSVSVTASGAAPTKPQAKWFHFRGRVLLVIPLALGLLAAIYVPRQMNQRRALLELKKLEGVVRTEPLALPLVAEWFGPEYATEIGEVYLINPALKDDDLRVLSGVGTLTKLELTTSPITDAGLSHLAGLTNLYTLHLAGTKVTDAGLVHLAGMKNLGILSLDGTGVTDAGMPQLAALPALERLFLNETQVGDAGLTEIAKLTGLKELCLNKTKISDAGLPQLAALTDLEILKVNETAVTVDGMMALQKQLPKCYIIRPGAGE
ncbi:MAG: leucine-rich repeat domain-containing protein [Pirellulaceae bacterium]